MSLSASTLGSLIASNLTSHGALGANKVKFANAVAAGIVMSIAGKTFVTADVGTTPGAGVGSGVGITGLTSSNMVTTSMGVMPSTGVNASLMFQSIHDAVVSHLSSNALLTSSHTPVFLGAGTIVVGSIPVSISEMAGNINTQIVNAGANGSNKMILCTAIATGVVTEILSTATGTVAIVGSPSGTPSPGAGAGAGVIS
jgi:hypothetical protein